MTEKEQAREDILRRVRDYCDRYHNEKKEFVPGERIPYASRVYDSDEMVNLVDSALEFWLTSGRYTDEFEKGLADYLHVRFASLVNSGSSANLLAFMALTSPLLGELVIPDKSFLAFSASSLIRCIAILSLDKSTPFSFLNSSTK